MAGPIFSTENFRKAFLNLCPRGAIWPREPGTLLYQVAGTLFAPYARNSTSANDLLVDSFPSTTEQLLPEWESSLGLPDPCAGTDPTLQQRQAQVVARLTDAGGCSIAYFVSYAAKLGFDITITTFAAGRAGQLRAGAPANSEAWAFAWRVNLPGFTVTSFRAGSSLAGEPLSAWGNAVLECEFSRLAPAHTIILFAQTTPIANDFAGDID